MTVDSSSGNVYVADRIANRIQKFQADGTFVWARNGTTGAGQFDQPTGVATDSSGNVYVTDRGNEPGAEVRPVGEPSWAPSVVGR